MHCQSPAALEPAIISNRVARLRLIAQAAVLTFGGKTVELLDPEALCEALRAVRGAVQAVPGAYLVIVGGLAVQEHGYARWTEDIDAVIDDAHFSDVLTQLRQSGFDLASQFQLKHRATGIELDLMREGTLLPGARSALPAPSTLGPNLGFASLVGLIRLKLIANRIVDQADISRLLAAHATEWETIRAALPPELLADFDRIALDAKLH